VLALVPAFGPAAPYSWFVGVVLAGALYLLLARGDRVVTA
jgi:nucleobase:cation symporter-1, NCS1 family